MNEQLTIFNRNTSYKELLDKLPESRARVLKALEKLGKATNKEISNFLGLPVNSVTGRCKELREYNVVIESGSKWDANTKRNVTLFQINYDRRVPEYGKSKRKSKKDIEREVLVRFANWYNKHTVAPPIAIKNIDNFLGFEED